MITLAIPTEMSHSVHGPAQGNWTYSDWEKLSDNWYRYEVIDGGLYVSDVPSNFHQYILGKVLVNVGIAAERLGYGIHFVGVLMPGCDPVQPDFTFVLKQNAAIIHDGRIHGVPDLIVEVIAPGSAAYDEGVKLEAYARAGVPEYAVIEPATRKLRLYALEMPGEFAAPREYSEGDSLSFDCLPDITLNVSDLFANAPDTTL